MHPGLVKSFYLGARIVKTISISDQRKKFLKVYQILKATDCVIILEARPNKDDITKHTLCEF